MKRITGIVLIGLSLAPVQAHADAATECFGTTVIGVYVDTGNDKTLPIPSEPPRIETLHTANQTEKLTKLLVTGPTLGSMDSDEIGTQIRCGPTGFVLTAMFTQSADYDGTALFNISWIPRIIVEIIPGNNAVPFDAVWNMRLTDGTIVSGPPLKTTINSR